MRAGLLSNPHVIAVLRTLFVPVHISALNTPHCMHDARDVELLRKCVRADTDDFDGGEREAFVLPDGTMQTVFMSLHGRAMHEHGTVCSQYTAEGRRSDDVPRAFRHHGAIALRAVHGRVPEAWDELWSDAHADVAAIAAEAPRWPEPAAGRQGFRVFVRNSYGQYDDLHGVQLALLDDKVVAAWGWLLNSVSGTAQLPREAFLQLAQAMVPRGMVDTALDAESISGELVLVGTAFDGDRVSGTIEGRFGLKPREKREVGKRLNAAVLFASEGRFVGRFTWDHKAKQFESMRIAAVDVQFTWKPEHQVAKYDSAPRHQIGIEWVRGPASVVR
ncbi:MAG TPA: hypothetical protein VF384_04025 [Planctomycetota bacterium]